MAGTALALTTLPKGVRQNNPLNIEQGDKWKGLAPIQTGRFCTFTHPAWGFRAAARIINGAYRKRGLTTIQEIVYAWAPPSDSNPTANYSRFVADRVGISQTLPLEDKHIAPMLLAMAEFENGDNYYALPMAQRGVDLA